MVDVKQRGLAYLYLAVRAEPTRHKRSQCTGSEGVGQLGRGSFISSTGHVVVSLTETNFLHLMKGGEVKVALRMLDMQLGRM